MIDARGYVCPMPVVMVQKEVKASSPAELQVMVDNQCAVENVTRFGSNQGYAVSVAPQGADFLLTLKK
jgi:tRNA 2-thiouridine synthesizing protein A